MLYELGGRDQPGACDTVARREAKNKARALVAGPGIRAPFSLHISGGSSTTFSWDHCLSQWKAVSARKRCCRSFRWPRGKRRRKIAVFLSDWLYRGGTLLYGHAIWR
jgi:hypothetical protein